VKTQDTKDKMIDAINTLSVNLKEEEQKLMHSTARRLSHDVQSRQTSVKGSSAPSEKSSLRFRGSTQRSNPAEDSQFEDLDETLN